MNTMMRISAVLAGVMAATGCVMVPMPTGGPVQSGTTVVIEEEPAVPYVDAYVSIPDEVAWLIADRVAGYSMPPVSRYGYEIYPTSTVYDWDNIPSYVESDFNGDGYSDHAYMFSKVRWSYGDWYLSNRMLVVMSTRDGYELSLDLDLGTVAASADVPVEEYWGIRLLGPGTHTITTDYGTYVQQESVVLEEAGLYLGSLDPAERSVFYVDDNEVYEIRIDMGSIAKRRVAGAAQSRGPREIRFSKNERVKTTVK